MKDEEFMTKALDLAKIAFDLGEVPVGALVVVNNQVVGMGFNQRELKNSCLEHAEIIALREASSNLGRWRLSDATVYTTLEPCFMCAGALVHARINRLVFGIEDPKFGAIMSLFCLADDKRLNHRFAYTHGILAKECQELLKLFFKNLRA
jgi:tRNA(adenine34) deaminase